jgi:hypothetical protein
MQSYGEILQFFKTQEEENVDALVPLIEEASLRHGLVAWKGTAIRFKEGIDECDETKSDREKWDWLWSWVEVDEQQFAVLAGVKIQETKNLITRLQGLRLVYPDGTVNRLASQYLRSIIMEKLEKGSKKPIGRPKKEKE